MLLICLSPYKFYMHLKFSLEITEKTGSVWDVLWKPFAVNIWPNLQGLISLHKGTKFPFPKNIYIYT